MGISTTPSTIAKLVQVTYDHFLAAQAAMKKPDPALLDTEMKATQTGLEKLLEATKQWQAEPTFPHFPSK